MTHWKLVKRYSKSRPEEFDTKSSALIIYQRRNFKLLEESKDEQLWEFEERKLSYNEYQDLRRNNVEVMLSDIQSRLDFIEEALIKHGINLK